MSNRSPIWKISKEEFVNIVKNNNTITAILRCCGLENKGSNHLTLKRRLNIDNIDYSHITLGSKHSKGKKIPLLCLSEEEVKNKHCCINSNVSRYNLKKWIIKYKLMPYICHSCKNEGMYNDRPLSLQLHHINGVSNDNTLSNLQFLCPNCHSQTDSFAGKFHKKFSFIDLEKSKQNFTLV